MRYGIVVSVSDTSFGPVVFRGQLTESIRKVRDLGFDGVELAIRDTEALDLDSLVGLLASCGLEVPAVGTGQIFNDLGLSLSDESEDRRRETVTRIEKVVDIASLLRARVVIGCVTGRIPASSPDFGSARDTARQRIARCLAECVEYARGKDVSFLLEPLNRYETNIFNTVQDVKTFLAEYEHLVDVTRFGVLADVFHANIEDASITESLRVHSDIIKHVHFADSNRLAPGFGHIPFLEIMRTLECVAYDGYISFEMLPLPTPEVAAEQSLLYVKALANSITNARF